MKICQNGCLTKFQTVYFDQKLNQRARGMIWRKDLEDFCII